MPVVLIIIGFQDQSWQASQLPWPIWNGDRGGIPGRVSPPLKLRHCLTAWDAPDRSLDSFGIQFDVSSYQNQDAKDIGYALSTLNTGSNPSTFGTTGQLIPGQVVVARGNNSNLKFQSGPTTDAFIEINTLNIQTASAGAYAGTSSEMMNLGTRTTSASAGNLGALGMNNTIDQWQTAFKNMADATDQALEYISTQRATYGSQINRISFTSTNLTAQSTNLQNSRSAIIDTDFAAETAKLTKGQIMQQAATAMLAQANQMPNVILSLLK